MYSHLANFRHKYDLRTDISTLEHLLKKVSSVNFQIIQELTTKAYSRFNEKMMMTMIERDPFGGLFFDFFDIHFIAFCIYK